jgi:CHAT domain-containing protein
MPNSFAQNTNIICSMCKKQNEAEIWLIVDTQERPDLVEKIETGNLNLLKCVYCGHEELLDVPLLLYLPKCDPQLVFSASESNTKEQTSEIAKLLLGVLANSIDGICHEEILERAVTLPKHAIPTFLKGGLGLAKVYLKEKQDTLETERLKIFKQICSFVQAKSWQESRWILGNYPDLLTEKALNILVSLIEKAHEKEEQYKEKMLIQHLTLLNRCSEVGIEKAFNEFERNQVKTEVLLDEIKKLIDHAEDLGKEFKKSGDTKKLTQQITIWQELLDHHELLENYRPYVLNSLGIAYSKLHSGEFAHNLNKAIHYYQTALEYYTPEKNPLDYAMIQRNLGNAYREMPTGDRTKNLQKAIDCYQTALIYYTPKNDPQGYATTKNNLGNAYKNFPTGDRTANLQKAISCYRTALEYHLPEKYPLSYAITQNNLGNAYREMPTNDETQNLQKSITSFQKALKYIIPEMDPMLYATIQKNLGNAYADLPTGDLTQNLQKAIDCYKTALEYCPPENDALFYASTQCNLGIAYREMPTHDETQNLQKSIISLQKALKYITPEMDPMLYAKIQKNLGNAYADLPTGDITQNLQKAIDCYQTALIYYTPKNDPQGYATTNINLGNAYRNLPTGDRTANLQKAITCYQAALEYYTPEKDPLEYAGLQDALGVAYVELPTGDWTQNLQKAIKYYQTALEYLTPENNPFEFACTQNNLGSAYSYIPVGDRTRNLMKAIACYKSALKYLEPEMYPQTYTATQNNLGNAYADLPTDDRTQNLQKAITCYQAALKHINPEKKPMDYALTHNNLASIYVALPTGDRTKNLQKAIACCQAALAEIAPEKSPNLFALIQTNLGNAYSNLDTEDRMSNIQKSISCYRAALVYSTPKNAPRQCYMVSLKLGDLYYQEEKYNQAIKIYKLAHTALEKSRMTTKDKTYRKTLQENASIFYARLVTCCLVERNIRDALKYAEAGKSRALVDSLLTEHQRLTDIPVEDRDLTEKLKQAQRLRADIENLLHQLSKSGKGGDGAERGILRPPSEIKDELSAKLRIEDALWQTIERDHPAFALTTSAPPYTIEQAQALAVYENARLVSLYQHAQGWVAFVVTQSTFTAIPLENVDTVIDTALKLLPHISKGLFRKGPALFRLLQQLYQVLFTPLEEYFPDQGQSLILAPFGVLHLLPLSAAQNPETGHYLADDFFLRIVPSLGTMDALLREAAKQVVEVELPYDILAVAYPGSEDQSDEIYLHGVLPEQESVVKEFPKGKSLVLDPATTQSVLDKHCQAKLLHFGCHGWFNPHHPETSGLLLKDGWLTARQVITQMDLQQADLVMLGACLSGQQEISGGDELTGLITAFIAARARAVVGTLWSVDDAATAYLMVAFYKGMQMGLPLDQALAVAQATVRSNPCWASPYYWAAFFLAGLTGRGKIDQAVCIEVDLTFSHLQHKKFAEIERERHKKGNGMKAETIFEDVDLILCQIVAFPQILDDFLSETERIGMDTLVTKLDEAFKTGGENGMLLLEAAQAFLTEIETTPSYLNLFCPDATMEEIDALQQQRKLPLNQEIKDKDFTHWIGLITNHLREYPYQPKDRINESEVKRNEKDR